ncbi:MAG: hypothetical protein V3T30_06835 [Thermodesulfobacteriota bacterium]
MVFEKFNKLEEQVKKLLEGNSSLEVENLKLLSLVKTKKAEVEWLKGRITDMDKEKDIVKDKIDGLIESLDGLA